MEQREIDEKVGAALESVGDGHFVFGCKNRYLTALLLVLKEAVNDQYDYIDWWLYDASPDYRKNFLSPAAEKAGRTPHVRPQNAAIGALCPCLGEGNLLHWAQKEAVRWISRESGRF